MLVGDVSLGEDDEILSQLLFLFPHGGSYVFYLSFLIVFLLAHVPVRLRPCEFLNYL